MKKLLVKGLMVLGVIGLGIFAGNAMVYAQFGTTQGSDFAGKATIAGSTGTVTLLGVIKGVINWVLGLLSLIALVMCLYGGFKMVTAAGDETKYKEGFKVLKQAAIGLIIIGLSWIMVYTIFLFIGGAATGNATDINTQVK